MVDLRCAVVHGTPRDCPQSCRGAWYTSWLASVVPWCAVHHQPCFLVDPRPVLLPCTQYCIQAMNILYLQKLACFRAAAVVEHLQMGGNNHSEARNLGSDLPCSSSVCPGLKHSSHFHNNGMQTFISLRMSLRETEERELSLVVRGTGKWPCMKGR